LTSWVIGLVGLPSSAALLEHARAVDVARRWGCDGWPSCGDGQATHPREHDLLFAETDHRQARRGPGCPCQARNCRSPLDSAARAAAAQRRAVRAVRARDLRAAPRGARRGVRRAVVARVGEQVGEQDRQDDVARRLTVAPRRGAQREDEERVPARGVPPARRARLGDGRSCPACPALSRRSRPSGSAAARSR
jgi:hypothetical protein